MRNTAAVRVGRLLEIRLGAGYRSSADVDEMFREIARATAGRPFARFVTVADWRRCPLMSGDAAERAIAGMARRNPLVERAAALVSSQSPTAVLQFVRMVRQSKHESRLLFEDAQAMVTWL